LPEDDAQEKRDILKGYVAIVDFLADMLGVQCEVVLHDLGNPDSAILAIRNGQISGRQVGGPLTDFGLQAMQNSDARSHYVNYQGKTKSGKILKSSTYFIKGRGNEVIGMLCVNFDVTDLMAAQKVLAGFLAGAKDDGRGKNCDDAIEENLTNSVDELLNSLLVGALKRYDLPPERMTSEEKTALVNELEAKGFFLLRGAVAEVAKVLRISEPTVYRYLKGK